MRQIQRAMIAAIFIWTAASYAAFLVMFLVRLEKQDMSFMAAPLFSGGFLLIGLTFGCLWGLVVHYLAKILFPFLVRRQGSKSGPWLLVSMFALLVVMSSLGLAFLAQAYYYGEPAIFFACIAISLVALSFSIRIGIHSNESPKAVGEDPRSLARYLITWVIAVLAGVIYGQVGVIKDSSYSGNLWFLTVTFLWIVCAPFGVILGAAFFKLQTRVDIFSSRPRSKVTARLASFTSAVVQILIGSLVIAYVSQKNFQLVSAVAIPILVIAVVAWFFTYRKTRHFAETY
jgi:LytS/YehU family sensor histidine kinase